MTIGGVNIPSFGQRTVTTRLRLRDGESNLLAGLFQDSDQTGVTGFPGTLHIPGISSLFAHNTVQNDQIDVVILLTPHVVRSHEITEDALKPIYIGSQQNLGVTGASPLIAAAPADTPAVAPPAPAALGTQPGFLTPTAPGVIANGPEATLRGGQPGVVQAPPGSSPVPGTVLVQPNPATAVVTLPPGAPVAVPTPIPDPGAPATPPAPPATASGAVVPPATPLPPAGARPAAGDPNAVPTSSQGIGSAQVLISPPSTPVRVGGGPYNVPLSITDAARISTITLTLIFDPARLRVRTVQEGSFMRAGGVNVVLAAGERRPRGHHADAGRGRHRRVRHGFAVVDSVRRDRDRSGNPDIERHSHRSRRHGDGAALHAGHD